MIKYIKILLSGFLVMGSFTYANASGDMVLDKANGIYWEDTQESMDSSEDFDDAILRCETMQLGGMRGWRLPTFRELLFIVDYNRYKPAANPAFEYVNEETYWSSSDFSATRSRAWTIDFKDGATYYSLKSTNHSVRCVRDIPEKKSKKDAK